MQRKRLLLIEDDVLLGETLARVLAAEPDLSVAAHCNTSSEALDVLAHTHIDVVLLKTGPAADAMEFVSACRAAGYRGKLILMVAVLNSYSSVRALQLGVSGIFLRSGGIGRLLKAIRLVASGEAWLEPDMIRILTEGSRSSLGDRDQQILRGVAEGLTNKRIATEIGIPEARVKTRLRRMFRAAGVRNRAQLTRATLEGRLGPAARGDS